MGGKGFVSTDGLRDLTLWRLRYDQTMATHRLSIESCCLLLVLYGACEAGTGALGRDSLQQTIRAIEAAITRSGCCARDDGENLLQSRL